MTERDLQAHRDQPVVVKLRGGSILTGALKENGDGTFGIRSPLGPRENPAYAVRPFRPEDVERVIPQ